LRSPRLPARRLRSGFDASPVRRRRSDRSGRPNARDARRVLHTIADRDSPRSGGAVVSSRGPGGARSLYPAALCSTRRDEPVRRCGRARPRSVTTRGVVPIGGSSPARTRSARGDERPACRLKAPWRDGTHFVRERYELLERLAPYSEAGASSFHRPGRIRFGITGCSRRALASRLAGHSVLVPVSRGRPRPLLLSRYA